MNWHALRTDIFNGTIIQIELKNDYKNTILIRRKVLFSEGDWYNIVVQGLKKIDIKNSLSNEYDFYTIDSDVSNILTLDLIEYINSLSKNYSFFIENNSFYIIDPHMKQKFLPGNIFNSLYKENKYVLSFEKDINAIIDIVKRIEEIGI